MIIGLAGKSCSGKNQVADLLQKKGFETLDLDIMAHDVLNSLSISLSEVFGQDILDEDGRINRIALGAKVFKNPDDLKKLENILYPELHKKLDDYIANMKAGSSLVVNAAALEKSGFWRKCDVVLWVQANYLIRLYRAWKRDRRPIKDLIIRFRAQRQLNSQYFFNRVDTYIIRNSSTRGVLRKRVDKWIKHLPPER